MPGSDPTLYVVGKVVTNSGNMVPKLTESVSPSFNPVILLLDLTIVQDGDFGTSDVAPRDVRFEAPAQQGQYEKVEMFFEGKKCLELEVGETH
ncbi:hypothetical protein [Blastomonas sp.]|uniref:hypothetical protein n=1 Tax=Blastomonas sp. TaxID=1909299 RepID=UPI0035932466